MTRLTAELDNARAKTAEAEARADAAEAEARRFALEAETVRAASAAASGKSVGAAGEFEALIRSVKAEVGGWGEGETADERTPFLLEQKKITTCSCIHPFNFHVSKCA